MNNKLTVPKKKITTSEQMWDIEKIKYIARKTPALSRLFIRFYLSENIPLETKQNKYWESITGMNDYIQQHRAQIRNHLKKHIESYASFEEFVNEIREAGQKAIVKKEFINKLPSKLRREANKYSFSDEDLSVISEYMKKNKELFRPPEISTDLKDHINYISERLREIRDHSRLKEQLLSLKYKNSEEVELVWNRDNIFVIRTIDADFIAQAGSPQWCLTYATESFFFKYINPALGYTQYLIFNLNYSQESPLFRIGITLDKKGKPLAEGHMDNFNKPVDVNKILNIFKIPSGIIVPHKYKYSTVKRFKILLEFLNRGNPGITENDFLSIRYHLITNGEAFMISIRDSKTFTLFLKNGVDVNIRDSRGNTALHHLAKNGDISKIITLLKYGANINIKNNIGDTPLKISCDYMNLEITDLLIKNGANVNVKNHVGNTALHFAAKHNHFSAVWYLLKKNANVNVKNRFDQTPIQLARERKNMIITWKLAGALRKQNNINSNCCNRTRSNTLLMFIKTIIL